MSQDTLNRARILRDAFDSSFAQAPQAGGAREDDLLAVAIGADRFAIRLSEIGGLFARTAITPLPSAVPELLGLVGLRGAVLPAYDLHALLGYPAVAAPAWLVLVQAKVVLAFQTFDGYLRVPGGAITACGATAGTQRPLAIRELAHTGDGARPIVHLPSLVEAITGLCRSSGQTKE
jgi:chemotaxis signal transduction protein